MDRRGRVMSRARRGRGLNRMCRRELVVLLDLRWVAEMLHCTIALRMY